LGIKPNASSLFLPMASSKARPFRFLGSSKESRSRPHANRDRAEEFLQGRHKTKIGGVEPEMGKTMGRVAEKRKLRDAAG